MGRRRLHLIAIPLLAAAVVTFPAGGQNSQGDHLAKNRSGGETANEFKFEVLSIHLVKRGPDMQVAITNPTPNGFTATAGMWQLLAFVYGPPAPAWRAVVWQTTEIRKEPASVNEEFTPLMRECRKPI